MVLKCCRNLLRTHNPHIPLLPLVDSWTVCSTPVPENDASKRDPDRTSPAVKGHLTTMERSQEIVRTRTVEIDSGSETIRNHYVKSVTEPNRKLVVLQAVSRAC